MLVFPVIACYHWHKGRLEFAVNFFCQHWCCRPLHDAVDSDCIEIVRLLLAAGADINLTTYSGKTVESLACSHDMRAFLRGGVNIMPFIYLIYVTINHVSIRHHTFLVCSSNRSTLFLSNYITAKARSRGIVGMYIFTACYRCCSWHPTTHVHTVLTAIFQVNPLQLVQP